MIKHMAAVLTVLTLAAPVTSLSATAQDYPGSLPDRRVATGSRTIKEAWLADATRRYTHFVLGADYEAAALKVRLKDGKILTLTLPDDSVFEDRIPRIADLDGDGADDIVVVRSYLSRGAAVAVVSVRDGRLQIIAETPPTGNANTWRNPAGIADFDGDGRPDIAEVQMPHVLGRLRVWTLRAGKLVEIATMEDTSNHAIGSSKLGLAAVQDFNGDGVMDLAIPSRDRRNVRILSFKGGARELSRHPLPAAATGNFALATEGGKPVVSVGTADGGTARIRP
jgi:FG-GAP-like repeat